MHLEKLTIRNYRNHANTEIELIPGVNIITGKNGEGKTNILEAIFYLASGRSHLGSRDNELIQWGASCFSIQGEVAKKSGKTKYDIQYAENGKKRIRINRKDIHRLSELIGQFFVVMFSPESLRIIQGSPQERRKYIDFAASQSSPSYFHHLHLYHRILTQRNELLKKNDNSKEYQSTLSVWNDQLIEAGSEVIQRRVEFLMTMEDEIIPIHQHISGQKEELQIAYHSSIGDVGDFNRIEIQQLFAEKLKKVRDLERIRGFTLTGPHRDDLRIFINGNDVQKFGSQGQQRTAALSLKLGEVNLLTNQTGEKPILLLDDVMSELDDERRGFLLDEVKNSSQTIITSTNLNPYQQICTDRTAIFTVLGGEVERRA